MKFINYLSDQLFFLFLQLCSMLTSSIFLLSIGNTISSIFFLLLIWFSFLTIFIAIDYNNRKKQLNQLLFLCEQLQEKYLISEVIQKPKRADDQVFYLLLKQANKSMLEKVNEVKREQKEYKEYMEQWIHEVKTPMTAMKLLSENHKSEYSRLYLSELEKLNGYVEQILYFARSEHLEKDYMVKEVSIKKLIHQSILEQKQLLLRNHVQIEVPTYDMNVYTDEKWIVFILGQLIKNAVQYKKDTLCLIFTISALQDTIQVSIQDNGIGIPPHELPHIFEKGFIGTNGRTNQYSTGLGLYLCKGLCKKLGIELLVSSNETGTTFSLAFYKNSFLNPML